MAYELFMDGFDYYVTADITKKWQEYYGPVYSIDATAGRRSSGALKVALFANNGGTITTKAFSPSSKVVVGFALKVVNLGRGVRTYFLSSGAAQFVVGMNESNQFYVQRVGGSIAATTENSFPVDSYQYVEIGLHLDDTGSYEVRVNGSSVGWFPSTSYDTLVTPGAQIDQVLFERVPTIGADSYMDDLYIAYGDELKWLGDSRVDALALTGNSTPQDWTPDTGNAWEQLNTATGYISATTANASSLFDSADLPISPANIHGVQINGWGLKSDSGAKEYAPLLKSGATTTVGTTIALSTDSTGFEQSYINNPTTSSAWNKSEIDSMTVGIKVIS